MNESRGRILKGIGGFYYVRVPKGIAECKARGVFRNIEICPVAGDIVKIEYDETTLKGVVKEILPRKNHLERPAVSNVDKLYIVCSTAFPSPNLLNIDKLIAIAVKKSITPVIVISKTDLEDSKNLSDIYKKSGFEVFETNESTDDGAVKIKESFSSSVCVFTGNSGVGKSTLINQMFPELMLKTGEISRKLSRGKHTTRQTELFELENGGFLADTPGFSSIDFESGATIFKNEVFDCFPEFNRFLGKCRFPDCKHIGEMDCGIKSAVDNGEIQKSRYESYCTMYAVAEKVKQWEVSKPRKIK